MDVLLVSARSPHTGEPPSAAFVRRLARHLGATRTDRVRWLCPWPPELERPLAPEGVELEVVPSAAPPFRKVVRRLVDLPTERRLVAALRDDPPDVVHAHGYGGAASYLLAWTADRLGVPSVVVADPHQEVLCHRGTLVDWTGDACADWSDPARCRKCTTARDPDALGSVGAMLERVFRPLGGRSPFPSRVDFENRTDMVVHGLSAGGVVVADPRTAEALVAWGVPSRAFRSPVPDADDVDGWRALYREACDAD